MDVVRQNKSGVLLMLAVVFIAPAVLAKLFLSMHWYHGGVTNHGQLLPESLSYSSLRMKNPLPHKWQILYLMPPHCDTGCEQQLFILNQSHIALGKEKQRVTPIVLRTANSDINVLRGYDFIQADSNDRLAAQLNHQQMVIVDPLGKLVMRYRLMPDKRQRLMQGRAMLSDLQKMLKLSRIG